MKLIEIVNSDRDGKKLKAVFEIDGKKKTVHFGAEGMGDFTTHKDKERKERFKTRFQKLINKYKDDPTKPMTLANMILWNKPSLKASIADFKRKYNL